MLFFHTNKINLCKTQKKLFLNIYIITIFHNFDLRVFFLENNRNSINIFFQKRYRKKNQKITSKLFLTPKMSIMEKKYFSKIIFALFLIFHLAVYGQKHKSINLLIRPSFKGKKITKDIWFITSKNDSIKFSKIQFYLTNFKIQSETDTLKINDSNFLINVFDETTLKKQLPHFSTNHTKNLNFNIGVEKHMNTTGALAGDLDPVKGMYWSWQSGYINFKIEGISPSCNTRKNKFQFHIGGYKAPYQTTKNISFNISLDEENNLYLYLNLESFFDTINLSTTNQVMIPGEKAKQIADLLPKLFSIK